MRDKIKDEKYFEEYLELELDDIKFYEIKLKSNTLKEDRILPVKKQINNSKHSLIRANYSMGTSMKEIKTSFIELLPDFATYWNSNDYVGLLWTLSIAIMLDIEEHEFSVITDAIANDNPNDYVVDFLIHSRDKNWKIKNTEVTFEKPYGYLKTVIEATSKEESLRKLQEYVSKRWYKGHSSAGWHNSHNSKHNTYAGYWSWEAGAIAKILELEDHDLKEQQYYPYDMVHFNTQTTV